MQMEIGDFMLEQLRRDSKLVAKRRYGWTSGDMDEGTMQLDSERAVSSASLLERISERRARGESFSSIAAALNSEGVSGRYGGRWYASSVRVYMQRRSQFGSLWPNERGRSHEKSEVPG